MNSGSFWQSLSLGDGSIQQTVFWIVMVLTLVVLLVAVFAMNKAVQTIYRVTMHESYLQEKADLREAKLRRSQKRKAFWTKLMGLHKLEEEKNLVIENHDFDGIAELDNPVPVWFNVLFYSTIIFAFSYLVSYHVFGWGMDQDQEYALEIKKAEQAREAYLAQAANQIDESTVEVDPSGAMAASGKTIFVSNCAACHGAQGEGGIGPNLTDRYWLHGGEISDVFKTVKYGVPAKGMVPWEQTLTPAQIAEVSNYIVSLRDTRPPNPKAPEGTEVKQYEDNTSSDSAAASDTLSNK